MMSEIINSDPVSSSNKERKFLIQTGTPGVTVPEMWPCVMKTAMVKNPLPPPPHFSVFWEVVYHGEA